MKKVLLIFLTTCLLFVGNVNAADLKIDYTGSKGSYELVLSADDKKISYDEAKKEFNLDDYIQYVIEQESYYFYLGKEVTKEEFDAGTKFESKKKNCDGKTNFCSEVSNQDELISAIDDAYSSRKIGEYHLLYSPSTYKRINFTEVEKYFKDKYMMDRSKNAYKYDEYGIITPIRFLPFHDENELIISTANIKITLDEEKMLNKFMDEFIKVFDGKSDYEKVLGAYSYIKKTSKYATEDTYTTALDGRHSPYDVLLTHKTVCIGSGTTFQYLMEKLGVESYIIDHVTVSTDKEFGSTHTYNVVKLDDKWFIVDATFDDGLLISNNGKYDSKDFKYLGIKISNKSYAELHPDAKTTFDMDYDKYVKLADDIVNNYKDNEKEEKEDDKESIKSDSKKKEVTIKKEYIYIIGIVLGICVVIIYFVKKE